MALFQEQKEDEVINQVSSYFSGFLAFFGLPIWTLRIDSGADSSYMAVGPAYAIGNIPILSRRFFAVFAGIPRIFPISTAVSPFIFILSEYTRKKLKNIVNLRHFLLTLCRRCETLLNIGWLPMAEERN